MSDVPQLDFWLYRLQPVSKPNARTPAEPIEGALIRDRGKGVGCIQPWPTLGDAPLEEHLEALRQGRITGIAQQALQCVEFDGLARRDGVNLFDRLRQPIPDSHWTAKSSDDPAAAAESGFKAVKLKCGADQEVNRALIDRWRVGAPALRLRLDFNDTGSVESVRELWESLEGDTRQSIDFFEDPVPWIADDWMELRNHGLPLAADRDVMIRADAADYLVVKPALINPVLPGELAYHEKRRLVITSNMDHAIGQLYAAYRAGEFAVVLPDGVSACGLLTHEFFEPDPFFEQIAREGPRLIPPPGNGLGFDDLLDSLPWKRLTD